MIHKLKHIVIYIGIFIVPMILFAQEDVASKEEMLIEQQNINFQTFFFEALHQKTIENYDKAIYALEACNNINQNNVAVLFELSKNYVFLLKFTEAEYYILKALEIEPSNLYILNHLKEIYTKQNKYKKAINIQKRINKLKPEETPDLVILYIKSGEMDQALQLMNKLDEKDQLPENLVILKKSLTLPIPIKEEIKDSNNKNFEEPSKAKIDLLKEQYQLKKDFNSLKLVLERELKTKKYLDLQKDSEAAINLFPAQAYVYLMHGTALNSLRRYHEAIKTFEDGLEYLVDDDQQKAQFMEQLSLSYKGLGNNKTASSYYKKFLDLRKK